MLLPTNSPCLAAATARPSPDPALTAQGLITSTLSDPSSWLHYTEHFTLGPFPPLGLCSFQFLPGTPFIPPEAQLI
jgi:hypothetical protein